MYSFNKIFVAAVLLAALVKAVPIDLHGYDTQGQDLHGHGHEELTLDYHAEPKYSFQYGVHDPHTGDEKQHIEERDGDVVKGTYTLKEADGTTRVVHYQADNHNGFNAVVHKIGQPHAQQEDHGHHY